QQNPDRFIVTVTHGGLGLPEREYYRRPDQQFVDIRTQYVTHIANTLTLAGQGNAAQVAAKARRIMALETAIAELHWAIADRRDRSRTYNPKTRAELKTMAPDYSWDAYFTSAGLSTVQSVVVREMSAMQPLGHLFKQTPVATWKEYLVWHYIRGTSDVLPKAFDDENFAFYGHILAGQPQQRERWKR